MELIPILSTIILVATISTFFLAIGAYILYKIRESKGQQAAIPSPVTVKGNLFTPAEPISPIAMEEPQPAPQPAYVEQPPSQYKPKVPLYTPVAQYKPKQVRWN